MGGFCSCFHAPGSHSFCLGCLFNKLKNKPANVYIPNEHTTSTIPLTTTPAASRPNDIAVSSTASSRQHDGESLQVQPEPFPRSDVHVVTKSEQGVRIFVTPDPLQKIKSYVKALPSDSDRFKCVFPDDRDECPTCLEEYTSENPKITTKCNHHYHLSCIYEWMERSENCPVCGKMMLFDE
ncbi:E3 ubiquitin-protein ligase RLIM-like [Salvia splendens]|uniref:E3 ubiquitin-protein ligase RLIM-like n=1 Tax=Salvia splendens TaxID=180675 RepID=UPI001C27CF59|nr:E3 ubiquitin-protein ligase RLIM-like [Salvia splendens]